MWTPDYFVRYVKLPRSIDGVVVPNDDGTFDIYLNSLLTKEQREKWLEHELRHIREDHFYRAISVVSIEAEANASQVPRCDLSEPPLKDGMLIKFKSLEHMLRYYRSNPDRILRDYAPKN